MNSVWVSVADAAAVAVMIGDVHRIYPGGEPAARRPRGALRQRPGRRRRRPAVGRAVHDHQPRRLDRRRRAVRRARQRQRPGGVRRPPGGRRRHPRRRRRPPPPRATGRQRALGSASASSPAADESTRPPSCSRPDAGSSCVPEDGPPTLRRRSSRCAPATAPSTSPGRCGRLADVVPAARFVQAEGGPRLNGALLDAGCIDELDLTIAPALVGGGSSRIVAGAAESLRTLRLVHVLADDDGYLFTRWVRPD